MRAVAAASPRVRCSAWAERGGSRDDPGRVSDEQTIARLDDYKDMLARWRPAAHVAGGSGTADPRGEADLLGDGRHPLAGDRLAGDADGAGLPAGGGRVGAHPRDPRQRHRLVTPVVEVDGRAKVVDIHMAPRKDPDGNYPRSLLYWGKYVAHDNNRDGMSLSLKLSEHVVRTFLEYNPTVFHDLHESATYLYTSTGRGPYNAWIDPILISEWNRLAFKEVQDMTALRRARRLHVRLLRRLGAELHVLGREHAQLDRPLLRDAGLAQRVELHRDGERRPAVAPAEHAAAAGGLVDPQQREPAAERAADRAARSGGQPRGVPAQLLPEEPAQRGEGAGGGSGGVRVPGDDPRPGQQARLLDLLQRHGAEVHRTTAPATVGEQTFPAGSYVSAWTSRSRARRHDARPAVLQPDDPRPYDDTGWTFGPLYNAETVRVEDVGDPGRADAAGDRTVSARRAAVENAQGARAFLINYNADNN
jgi:hypothetical protein